MLNLAELLHLERPLAVIDLETTGFDPQTQRIAQIAVTVHYPHREPIAWSSLINPEMSIPVETTKVHGIRDADVAGKPTFRQIAASLAPKILNVDIAGYNVTFDIGFLRAEMKRCNVEWSWAGYMIDSWQIFKRQFPHNLTNAYKQYVDREGFADAHQAANDVTATEQVLAGQLNQHKDLPRDVKALSEYCFPPKPNAIDTEGKIIWHNEEACIAFGKHAKKPLRLLERGYMQWILDNDFPQDVKEIIRSALMGVFPTKG